MLLEISAGCTDSWELYERTRGIDFDVTPREWGEVAESIELSAGAPKVRAWAAARRSVLCWMMSVNRRLDLGPQLEGGPQDDNDVDEAVLFLLDAVVGESRDLRELADDELRRMWVSLALSVGPGDDPTQDDEDPLQERCRDAERELDRRGLVPTVLVSPKEYRGEKRLSVDFRKVVGDGVAASVRSTSRDWVAFFAEPHGILHVDFPFRLPKAVFSALAGQRGLLSISMMWSDIDDLTVLRHLPDLRRLTLDTGVPAVDADPLGDLENLEHLQLQSRRGLTDFSALGRLAHLETLDLNPMAVIESIDFVRTMPSLGRFSFSGRVRGKDYTPLLDRPDLDWVRIRPERGMTPSLEELRASVPGLVLPAGW
jgi:hypothetical protein